MVATPAAPSRLTARQRTRRAARGGASRSVPVPLLAPALIAVAFLVLPLAGLLIRAPWGRLGAALSGSDATQALVLSLWTAIRGHGDLPGHRCAAGVGAGPDQLPRTAAAARPGHRCRWCCRRWSAGSRCCWPSAGPGSSAAYLDSWFGLTIPFTPIAVVMAETFVAMPFLIITVEGALRSADQGFEEAAATLGATRMTVFRRVTVPLVAPSLGAGAVLCWARALGEFGATITFAGSFPGRTETMPIAVYYALETDPDAAIALSLVLLLVSVVVLVSLRDRWLRRGSAP